MGALPLAFIAFPLYLSTFIPITEDYSKAEEIAQDHSRPMLIFFTGSDWSVSSQEAIQECKSEEFEKTVENQFVLVQADYPEINSQTGKFLKQNQALKEKYHVETFPTIVMTDPEGREITRLGFIEQTPKAFGEHLRDLYLKYILLRQGVEKIDMVKTSIQAIEEMYKRASELRCPHYMEKLLQVGLKADEGVFFPLEKYAHLVRDGLSKTFEAKDVRDKIIQRDPENREMARLRLALLDFQARGGEDPALATEPLGTYIADFGSVDDQNLQKLHLIISEYFRDNK